MLFHHDLILKRLKKMTFHFKNRNTANYLFDKFFEKMPNLEHLFIAEIENLTEEQVNKLPVLFPKLTNLEMHAYRPVEFPIEFIRDLPYLQTLVIRSNGFLQTSLHHIVKDLQYLTNLEIGLSLFVSFLSSVLLLFQLLFRPLRIMATNLPKPVLHIQTRSTTRSSSTWKRNRTTTRTCSATCIRSRAIRRIRRSR